MRINAVNSLMASPNFGNALSTKQEKKYRELMDKIQEVEGKKDAIRVVKLYAPALPSNYMTDTGIGKVNSPEAQRFYQMAHIYGGATAIKFMPMGQLTDKQVYNDNHKTGAYNRSALTIGEDVIDVVQLATKAYGNILPKRDVDAFIDESRLRLKKIAEEDSRKSGEHVHPENRIDFETTLGWRNQEDYPVNKLLRTAFENFKNKKEPNAELKLLRKEFEEFKNQKKPVDYDDIYTRIALFPYLKDWTTAKTDFFVGFDRDPNVRAEKMPQYEAYKKQFADEIEFFKFKQFLANKTIQEGVELVHKEGMDAIGDCELGFSWVEEQVFPDAFLKDGRGHMAQTGDWDFGLLNYNDLMNDQSRKSPAHKLLKAKMAHLLSIYDGLRFDVGWSFMRPAWDFGNNNPHHADAGTTITSFIEDTAAELKGKNFDQRKLMYECDADGNDFSLEGNSDTLRKIKGMAILSTEEEHNEGPGWGNYAYITEDVGLRPDDFILGTNNHDKEGVINCAYDHAKSTRQVGGVMRSLHLREEDGVHEGWREVKDDSDSGEHVKKITRGRNSEVDLAKNVFLLYLDLLGRRDKVDYHTNGSGTNSEKDYKTRLERNYEENAHKAWQYGVGYNMGDIKSYRSDKDHTRDAHRALYEAAAKYAEYIRAKGGIYTRTAANHSSLANVNIENLTFDEIKALNTSC